VIAPTQCRSDGGAAFPAGCVDAERLLEAFATRANIGPKNSYRIRDPDALPLTLQRVMFNAAQQGRIWLCRARGSHSWLFTCETRDPISPER